jgi:hypothetical protein
MVPLRAARRPPIQTAFTRHRLASHSYRSDLPLAGYDQPQAALRPQLFLDPLSGKAAPSVMYSRKSPTCSVGLVIHRADGYDDGEGERRSPKLARAHQAPVCHSAVDALPDCVVFPT